MADPHLNLFYSYNQDNELIENNLTRAWIVSLRLLEPAARDGYLQLLLDTHLRRILGDEPDSLLRFHDASFALQSHVDQSTIGRLPVRLILTIASNLYEAPDTGSALDSPERLGPTPASIPDAWIFDEGQGYCILIEAKIGANPLSSRQLYSHAADWLGISTRTAVRNHLIPITWYQVAEATSLLINDETAQMNRQERMILEELVDFLALYDYRPFPGITFTELEPVPEARLLSGAWCPLRSQPFGLYQLSKPPAVQILAQIPEALLEPHLDLGALGPAPQFEFT